MAEKTENTSISTKLNDAILKYRVALIAVIVVVFAAIAGTAVAAAVIKSSVANGLEQVDTITYNLTKDADGLGEAEVAQRFDAAVQSLVPLSSKGGIVGARASILLADILFQKKDFSGAKDAWLKAAAAKKGAYFAGMAYYNAGVCCENLNDTEGAVANYKKASDDKYFALIDHALFSLGRVYEQKGDYTEAASAYNKLNDTNPDSSWAHLAKSRLIALKAAGNIQ